MNLENNRAGSDGLRGTSTWKALATGAAGAATVTLANEVVRQLVPHPPRLDRVGMAALVRLLHAAGASIPRRARLRGYSLIGDLASNALFYAPLAVGGKRPLLRGLALGVAAGVGAVMLTPLLARRRRVRAASARARAITVALYALGGVVAGAVASLLDRPTRAGAPDPDLGSDPYLAAIGSGVAPQTGEW